MKKENKIRIDFHGYFDYYYLIKGTAIALGNMVDINDEEKVNIIIENIERNFGGIEYEIDINFKSRIYDIEDNINELKRIIEDYDSFEENKKIKLNSIFLFKQLYNIQCKKMEQNYLKIDANKMNDYNINKCINDNINDINSRYLLIATNPYLYPIIYQYIKLNNPYKQSIILYEGSPFVNDNNDEYIYKKLTEIKEDIKEDKLIIIENLNQIHPYLYDLYGKNYQIIEEQRYTKIYLDSFSQINNLVNDEIKIILLVDKRSYKYHALSFSNRFEKINLKFDNLLDNQLKMIARNLIDELEFKYVLERFKYIYYSLEDLLINCREEDIKGLIYYCSQFLQLNKNDSDDEDFENEKIDEKELKEKVLDKIYKILPQDIISILPENNIIKIKYFNLKNIYNINDYIKSEENKIHKISIIYTFTSLSNTIEGLSKNVCILISEIKSENDFKNIIEDIKIKNGKLMNDDYICIHFVPSDSKKIKFITNFILNTFKDDNYNYLIFLHINRNFDSRFSQKVYTLYDINPDINQIFIDNLFYNNHIRLNDLFKKNVDDILKDYRE